MIKIGTNLTLERQGEDEQLLRYRCRIVEIKEQTISIDYPIDIETGRTDIFPEGTLFTAYFVGKDGAVYKFNTELKGKKKDKIPMLLLHYNSSQFKKIQRRQYVRIRCNLDVAIHDPGDLCPPYTTITADISGGGAAIVLPIEHAAIEPNKTFNLWIVIPENKDRNQYLSVQAKAIRTHKVDHLNRSLLSMKFINIDENTRQKIIQYCFETQLKERRKQLE